MSTTQLFLRPNKSARRYFRAAFDSEGHIRPWMSVYGKGERRWPRGVYYLRIDGAYQRLSNDPCAAVAHLERVVLSEAYRAGYRKGRSDGSAGKRCEHAWWGLELLGPETYDGQYSRGYRAGWSKELTDGGGR